MPRTETQARPVKRKVRIPNRSQKLAAADAVAIGNSLERVNYAKPGKKQNERRHYGRDLDLNDVDSALRKASRGDMMQITDMGRETLRLDAHLSGVLNKRLNRAGAIGWNLVANDGTGRPNFDHGRARERADFVRAQIMNIPHFRQRLMELRWSTWDARAAHEMRWEVTTGGSIGDSSLYTGWKLADLHWIHPRRLSFDQERTVVVTDDDRPGYGFEPTGFRTQNLPEKFVVSTPRMFCDYPELEGLSLRCQYWSFFQRLGTRERLMLMEIFGTPWRLAYAKNAVSIATDTLRESFDVLQKMNGRNAGWLPHGVEPFFYTPPAGSGEVHKEVIQDARLCLTKLVLGATGTTDAVPTGLGSSIGDAHLSEEDLVIATDLFMLADVIEHRMVSPIIELNYGPEELAYAPIFQFDLKTVVDRSKKAEDLGKALDLGMPIALEQAYEVLGWRQPRENEPVLVKVLDKDSPMPTLRNRVVWPIGQAPKPGEIGLEAVEVLPLETSPEEAAAGLEFTPSSLEAFVTVNEARSASQLTPLLLPDGTPDPDGELTVEAYRRKQEAKQAVVGEADAAAQLPPPKPSAAGLPDAALPAPPDLPVPSGEPPPELPGLSDDDPAEKKGKGRGKGRQMPDPVPPFSSPSGLTDDDLDDTTELAGRTRNGKRRRPARA